MDNRNLKRPCPPILLQGEGPPQPHLGPVTRSVAAGKPCPERRNPYPKNRRPAARRPDSFSEKYRRLMEAMGRSDEGVAGAGTAGADGVGPGGGWDQGPHGGPQKSPRHPDSYSVQFRTLMEVMGRSTEERAGSVGGNVAVATPATGAKAADGQRGGKERERDGRRGEGEEERGGIGGPALLQSEEEEGDEERDDGAELDWMAAMVEALIDGELRHSQTREPEAVRLSQSTPTAQPALVMENTLFGPIRTEHQSPGTWGGVGMTPDLEVSLSEDILMGLQLPSPPLSLVENLDFGQDSLSDLSLFEWPFYTGTVLSLPRASEPNAQAGQGRNAPSSAPGNTIGHLES